MFFLQINKNISLKYYDFANLSALHFLQIKSEKVCVAEETQD